jgi:hypothetical protein
MVLPNPPAPATFVLETAIAGKTPSVDTNADGTPDGISIDTDADGAMDATAVDSDGDMKFDKLIRDLNSDGVFEAVVELPPQPMTAEPTACKVDLTVATANYGGKYGNKNSGAVWVTDEAGMYVRTLKAWSKARAKHVQKWFAASNNDRTNAVSTASLGAMQTHMVTWDCTGSDNTTVLPFGKYIMHFEFTSNNGTGPYLPMTFERGAMATEVVVASPVMGPKGEDKGFPMGGTLKYSPTM